MDYWSVVVFLFRHACLRIKGIGFCICQGSVNTWCAYNAVGAGNTWGHVCQSVWMCLGLCFRAPEWRWTLVVFVCARMNEWLWLHAGLCIHMYSCIHWSTYLFNKHLLSKISSFSDHIKFENWGNFGKCSDAWRNKIHSWSHFWEITTVNTLV